MTTFDAIAHVRRESLSRSDALRFLMVNLGLSAMYAEEVVSVIFAAEESTNEKDPPLARVATG